MPKCPECGIDLATVDPYAHAINCFHLPNKGIDQLLATEGKGDDVRSQRIREILLYAKPKKEGKK